MKNYLLLYLILNSILYILVLILIKNNNFYLSGRWQIDRLYILYLRTSISHEQGKSIQLTLCILTKDIPLVRKLSLHHENEWVKLDI
jgi:hypothetical protein